ncbi:integrase catalytic domain-containing protein [Trichonephila clavipes]|nr:integrase catalytic domain-containing protein [Trichonephila clavipes]
MHWPLAKVIRLIPGKDGKIRTVELKTRTGTMLRPIQRVYPLEVQSTETPNDPLNDCTITNPISSISSDNLSDPNDSSNVLPRVSKYGRVIKVPEKLDLSNQCADASPIRSARILRLAARTANATGPSCLGNPHPIPSSIKASDFCSPYQGYIDKADSTFPLPYSGNDKNLDMANLPTDMELELASTQRTLSRTPSPQPQLTPCEQLKFNKAQLAKVEAFRKCKQACVDTLKQMSDHYPDEPFYQRALTELQDIEETMAVAVSDIDSYDLCTIPGCPHHEITPPNSPIKFTQTTPKINSLTVNPCKRKDNSNFEYPPQRKTARKVILDFHDNEEINLSPNKFELPKATNSKNLENPGSPAIEMNSTPPGTENENIEANNSTNQSTAQNALPPPIMLFVEDNYKTQKWPPLLKFSLK